MPLIRLNDLGSKTSFQKTTADLSVPPFTVGWDIKRRQYVTLPPETRTESVHIIAAPGVGKSVFLETCAVNDAKARLGVIFIDVHGDALVNVLWRLIVECPERIKDIVILDAGDCLFPFALPMYRQVDINDQHGFLRSANQTVHVLKSFWGKDGSEGMSWGPVLNLMATMTAHTFVEVGLTLDDIGPFLVQEDFRARVVAQVSDRKVRQYWTHFFPQSKKTQEEYYASFVNKVLTLWINRTVSNIVSQRESKVDFRQLADEQKIVLIPLRIGVIGEEAVSFLGSIILGELFLAARSREDIPERERKQVMVYLDEYQLFQSPDLPEMEAQLRKYRFGLHKAHQFLSQLQPSLQDSARMATVFAMGRLSGADSPRLAADMDNPPQPGEPEYKSVMVPSATYPGRSEQLAAYYGRGRSEERVTQYQEQPGPMVEVAAMQARRANELNKLRFHHFQMRHRDGEEITETYFRALASPCTNRELPKWVEAEMKKIHERSRGRYCTPRDIVEGRITYGAAHLWEGERAQDSFVETMGNENNGSSPPTGSNGASSRKAPPSRIGTLVLDDPEPAD